MNPPNILCETWRTTPHTFAEKASYGRWVRVKWLECVGSAIASAIYNKNGRLIINAPVRMGKSELISHWLPVWYLDSFPQRRIAVASYGAALASGTFGAAARNEFAVNPLVRAKLRMDSKAKDRWNTYEGGGMRAAGIGGTWEGLGYNCGILDDPYANPQDAHSYQYNETLWAWYDGTFAPRAEPNATIIVAMARWTDWDFVARLLKNEPGRWKVLSFPALIETEEQERVDPIGRKIGDPLFPERYSRQQLEDIRRDRGHNIWKSRYQQAPEGATDRLYGQFSHANEDDTITVNRALPLACAWDFNIAPGNHCEIFQYDKAADMFYFLDEIHGPRMDVRTGCDRLRAWMTAANWPPITGSKELKTLQVFGDASGGAKWAGSGDSCYDILQRALANVPHWVRRPAANPPIIDRLNTVNEALRDVNGRCHVKIHSRCARLLEDLREMKPDEFGMIDKTETRFSHASDGSGYAISYLRPLYGGQVKVDGGTFVLAGAGTRR